MHERLRSALIGLAAVSLSISGCDAAQEPTGAPSPGAAEARDETAAGGPDEPGHSGASPTPGAQAHNPSRDPLKQAYFGDLHVHTSWSLDAFAMQVQAEPEDAYRYARGEAIEHASGDLIQLRGAPLDFLAVTEHANFLGIPTEARDPKSPLREIPLIRDLMNPDPRIHGPAMGRALDGLAGDPSFQGLSRDAYVESTWRRLIDLADRHDAPGEFTAFVGYEYTSAPEGQNLHRNVLFRGSDVPARPFSSLDSPNPEDLWRWMDRTRESGADVLAIPHNANASNGLMYAWTDFSGRPIDAAYAETRMRNEPVSEVMQIKGQSETHPLLSPNDEWAAFQIFDTLLGSPGQKSRPQGSYARRALMDGLEMEEASGINPYRFGMIGSSDGHNASSPVEEDNFTGKLGIFDATPEARILPPPPRPTNIDVGTRRTSSAFSAAGLAGIWAESNTRADLFDALRRREVFATSGPRIAVRFFAGWDLSASDLEAGIVQSGYARGVAMGSALKAAGPGANSPTFLIQALRDPREATLERIQIVKAWVDEGKAREQVYDVACADESAVEGGTHRCPLDVPPPDLRDCSIDASRGRADMAAAWQDPDFDPTQRALYYVRVLQIPTCHWSTYDAIRLGVAPPAEAPHWIQERAVTSPIWYAP